jgi:hypothetical protein
MIRISKERNDSKACDISGKIGKKTKKNVRFSLKNLQNMPKMFRLATLGDQFKMCAPSKLKSWIRV